MKIDALILALLMAAPCPSLAQSAWVSQALGTDTGTSSQTTPSIRFFGTVKGWALTPEGRLLKTLDGGAVWSMQTAPAGKLRAVSFLNPDTGWAAALTDTSNYVYAFRTFNGGTTWEQQGHMPRSDISGPWAMHFVTPDSGWVFSSWAPFFKTSDGGQTWKEPFGDPDYFYKSHFSQSGMAWCLMRASILKKDTGAKWTEVTKLSESLATHAIFFADSNRGWIAGNGGIVRRTDDQGKTWNPLTGTGTQKALHALYFSDRETGWALGDSGTALRTLNGGTSWTPYPANTLESIVAVEFTDARTGWAMGSKGSIFRTDTAYIPVAIRGTSGARNGDASRLSFASGKLRYQLERTARVTLTLRAIDGTREALLFDGRQSAGAHFLDLAGIRLAPGIHVVTLDQDGERAVKTIFIP